MLDHALLRYPRWAVARDNFLQPLAIARVLILQLQMTITPGWLVFLRGGVTALGKHVDNQEGVREANSHVKIIF